MPEPLPPDYQAALTATASRRGRFGEPTHFLTETDSTNDVAAALADRGATEGTTVVALAQRAGRGRLGRVWFSPPGAGLYVSVVCRDRSAVPLLTIAGGVAVAEGIRAATGLPVEIKWPNDIVVREGRSRAGMLKLAGILAEASTGADGRQQAILGFGINLHPAVYPPGLAGLATSIVTELGRSVDPAVVLAETLAALNMQVRRLASGDTAATLSRWRALAPSAVGSAVEWDRPDERRRGTTAGIDEEGALLVRAGDIIERVFSGEVRWL